jgi:NADPH:quinone reductase-like Zn-dependent oxidoreductase
VFAQSIALRTRLPSPLQARKGNSAPPTNVVCSPRLEVKLSSTGDDGIESPVKTLAAPDYGPLESLALLDAPLPTPGPGEVRVRVVASALNPADYKVILGTTKFLHGRKRPLVLGYDFSGTVAAVGRGVAGVSEGDDVFGFLPYGPGSNRGAFAEALIAKSDSIAPKPKGVSHEIAAAAATTGLTAMQAMRDVGHMPAHGANVIVTGVSGGVGSIGIGVARKLGARVIAVGSGSGVDLARGLGAIDVFDRTKDPLPPKLAEKVDLVLDAAAAYRWRDWRGVLKAGGTFVTTLPTLAFLGDTIASWFSKTRTGFANVKSRPADLRILGVWLTEGLEVPLTSTVAVRDVARGLAQLQRGGGRISVQVADGF